MLGHVHVARQPLRHELPLAVPFFERVGRDATVHRTCVLGWGLEGAADRAVERHDHPLAPFGVLPRGERAPDALAVERLRVIAEKRRGLQRGAIVRTAKIVPVEQPQPAFLARRDQELPSSIVEGHRCDVQVEVAPKQPVGVGRRKVVHQLQLLVRVEPGGDERGSEGVGLGGKRRVAGAHEHAPLRIDGHTAPAPHPAPGRGKDARGLRGEIVGEERVGVSAASLSGRRIDDAVVEIQRVRLAVRSGKLLGWRDVGARRDVERVKAAVPRERIQRVLALGRRGRDGRYGGLPAWTQRAADAGGRGGIDALELFLPDGLTARDVDRVELVRDARKDRQLAGASGGRDAGDRDRCKEVVHLPRRAVDLHLPQQLHRGDVGGVEDFFVLQPAGASVVDAFGQVVLGGEGHAGNKHERSQPSHRNTSRNGADPSQRLGTRP